MDEAHHIEDIATDFLANRLHRLELMRVLGRLAADKQIPTQGKLPLLREKIQMAFNKTPPKDVVTLLNRLTIDLPALRLSLNEQIHRTFDKYAQFIEDIKQPNKFSKEELVPTEQKLRLLAEHHAHPQWQEEIIPNTQKLIEALKQYQQVLISLETDLQAVDHDRLQEQTKSIRLDIQAYALRLDASISILHNFLQQCHPSKVRWIEMQPLKTLLNVHLVDADIDISKTLVDFLFSKFPTIVLCSATLTTNRQFSFYAQKAGSDRSASS